MYTTDGYPTNPRLCVLFRFDLLRVVRRLRRY
jgi:hypothetical protein